MLDDWQFSFATTAMEINDNTITFQHVIHFMTIQETTFNAKKGSVPLLAMKWETPMVVDEVNITEVVKVVVVSINTTTMMVLLE